MKPTEQLALSFALAAMSSANTLSVTTTTDSGAGSLRAQIAAAASGDTIAISATGTVTLTTGEIAGNPDIAGSSANPTGDGIVNLMKYALGLDPLVTCNFGPLAVLDSAGFLRLSVDKNPAATDVSMAVEVTGNLG